MRGSPIDCLLFRLSYRLGIPKHDLERKLSSAQITEYMAFDAIEHYEPTRNTAMICQAASSTFRDEPLPLDTWLPRLRQPIEPASEAEIRSAMNQLRGY